MRLEIFIGLTDRHGKSYNWNMIYSELAEKISEITYATLFPGLKGIYKNEWNKLISEDSAMFLIMTNDDTAEKTIEKLKDVFRWFLRATDQESVLMVKNLTEFEYIR